ncbi:Crp/Fnr family transcriptional regulator [Corallibacter sp.]|uniref:Crp/Fnr family transcriptional regulator n=1 Tax=Corallibacter sp. TaxID=2038084 RepID=UPI003A8D9749
MYESIISHVKNYVEASNADIQVLTDKLNEVCVSKHTYLLQPGTHVMHEYFVIKGCLIAYYLDSKGHKHTVQFAIENWWVGDFDAFFNHKPSNLFIETIESSKLFSITYDDLNTLFQEAPIYERYFRLLTTNAFIAQRKRILSALQNDTKTRYLEFCNAYPNIEDRVPNYHIANYLGVSAESLSRIRRKLKG